MNKLKTWWNEHKREILVGIIVSIITTILWSIITWFIKEAPKMGITILESIRNVFYRSAAIHTESSVSEMIFGALFGSMLGLIIVLIHYINSAKRKIMQKENTVNKKEIQGKSDKKDSDKNSKKLSKIKKSKILLNLGIILLVVNLVFTIAFVLIPTDIYKKFNRDITIISPYVELQEIIKLKSEWVMMDGYDDYQEIYVTINTVKENNNLSKR